MQSFIFDASKMTPAQLAKRRELAAAMTQRATSRTPQNLGEGINAVAAALSGRIMDKRAGAEEKSRTDAATQSAQGMFSSLFSANGGGAAPNAPTATPAPSGGKSDWEAIRQGIFKGESGGDYNALFDYSNRDGKQFAGTNLTDMSVDQALAFADPKGPYAQFVKSKVGRVATPMGAYQVVGSTLRDAKQGLGLTGQEQMSQELQDKIGQYIFQKQGTGAWEGYQGPQTEPVRDLAQSGYPMGGQNLAQAQPQMPPMGAQAAMQPGQGQPPQGRPMPIQPQQQAPQQPQGLSQGQPQGMGQNINPQQLMQIMSNPYTPAEYKQVAGVMLERMMGQSDPSNQLDMQMKRAQLEALQNPPAKVTDDMREYDYAKSQGFQGSLQDWIMSQKASGTSLSVNPDGTVSFQQGMAGGMGKALTEAQSKDTTFVTRAAGALPIIDETGNALTRLGESVGGSVPAVGNYLKSPEFQRAEQAGKEFLQAILRKDTGAAITPAETAEYGSVYLPRPGDSPEVLVQKQASRRRALQAIQLGLPPQAILKLEQAGVDLSGGANAVPNGSGPQPGTVEDGYRYKGGNPSDPNSWERVQ